MLKITLLSRQGNFWKRQCCLDSVYSFCCKKRKRKKLPNLSSLIGTYFTVNALSLKQFTSPYSNHISPDLDNWYPHISNAQSRFEGQRLNVIYGMRGNNKRVWCGWHTGSIFTFRGLLLEWTGKGWLCKCEQAIQRKSPFLDLFHFHILHSSTLTRCGVG